MVASTTHATFGATTEALDVAKAFGELVHGKTVMITGVNRSGIGFATAEAFASQSPAHLILASRTPAKVAECVDLIKAKYPGVDYRILKIDLSRQTSVRAAANEVLGWSDIPTVDILVNNAAISLLPERMLNEDGIEMHLGTNHIGHFLLTCMIMPKLAEAAKRNPRGTTRVVNVTSNSACVACMRWSDLYFDKVNKTLPPIEQPNYNIARRFGIEGAEELSYVPIEAYNQSKVANLLFTIGLNRRVYEKHGILSVATHPGFVPSELMREATVQTVEAIDSAVQNGTYASKTLGAGASTSLVAALDPKLAIGETVDGKDNYGSFMKDCQISHDAHPLAVSNQEAERLWTLSQELVKENFAW